MKRKFESIPQFGDFRNILFGMDKAVFTGVSRVICVYFGFALLCSANISKTKTNHKLNQNLLQLVRASFLVPRVIASSFDGIMDCGASFVIDQGNYFSYGLQHAIENCSNIVIAKLNIKFATKCINLISSKVWLVNI